MTIITGTMMVSSRRRRRCRSQLFRFLTIITPELLFIGDNPPSEQKDTKLPDSSAPCTPPIKLLYIILYYYYIVRSAMEEIIKVKKKCSSSVFHTIVDDDNNNNM